MSEENVEVSKRAFEAFAVHRDTEAALLHVDPEIELRSAIIGGAEGNTNRGLRSPGHGLSAMAWLVTFRGGKIANAQGYLNPQDALEAAGLSG